VASAHVTARRCLVVVFHLLQPGRHFHGADPMEEIVVECAGEVPACL
jgi:hypothetical protein